MVDKKIISEWLNKADEDFNFASSVMKNGFYVSHVCFHFQQSGEKYLKAFIIYNELEFRKIHNLVELLEICKKADSSFEYIREECKFLTTFYIASRYPVPTQIEFGRDTVEKAKENAEKIMNFVKEKIKIQ